MKNVVIIIFMMVFVLQFTGCSDRVSSNDVTSINDLEVPEGFYFETTHLINVEADGPVTRTVLVTQENGDIVYKGLLNSSSGFNQNILVSSSITSLNFTYNGQVITKPVRPSTCSIVLNFTAVNRDDPPDSDGDGVPDDEDDFPDDATLAYKLCYPAQPQPADTTRCWSRPNWSTLAYEDLWPSEGDYDFNDVIINYQITEWMNWCGNVRYMNFDLYYSVDGAGYNNGFYFKVPFDEGGTVEITYPDSIPYRDEGFDYFYDTENSGDGNLVLRIFEQSHSFMTPVSVFHNTEEGSAFTEPFHFVLQVELVNSEEIIDRPVQDFPPYNPFLVVDQDTGREVHFANYHPTARINLGLLGTGDDTTDLVQDRYYVNADDLPWSIHIPSLFDHPLEKISIIAAYPYFADWVTSGGNSHADWYEYPVESNVYDFVDQFNDFQFEE